MRFQSGSIRRDGGSNTTTTTTPPPRGHCRGGRSKIPSLFLARVQFLTGLATQGIRANIAGQTLMEDVQWVAYMNVTGALAGDTAGCKVTRSLK